MCLQTFSDEIIRDHPLIQEFLFRSVHNLLEELRRKNIGQFRDPVQFFIALDETSNLHKKDNPEPTILVGFRRIFRLLRRIPVWTFVLSTKRPLHHVAPAVAMDLSARIKAQVYRRVPPFYAFLASLSFFDISTSMLQKERQKSILEFSSVNHLARIGRPLWQSYLTSRPQVSADDALSFVDLKLFCGQTFDPANDLMLVAFLSNRVALDPCLNRLESTSLEERSVSSHLRWISHVHTTTGIFKTITLEEPIVCAAAARAVCTPSAAGSWKTIMMKVFERLCTPGLIDRGRTGELFLRCVFINARDTMFRELKGSQLYREPEHGGLYSSLSPVQTYLIHRNTSGTSIRQNRPRYTGLHRTGRQKAYGPHTTGQWIL